jgi:murein DD-endopeptidase MepM/ murein hydrolase activator NlpD
MVLCALLVAGLFGALTLGSSQKQAYATTSAEKQAEVEEAFGRLDALQTELNQIAIDYDAAILAHSDALARMQDAQSREEAARVRIAGLQEQLGGRASHMYRSGSTSYLDVLFGAKSFTEFINAMDLINRVNEQDARLVVETKTVRAEAEAARIEYTEQEKRAREKQEQIGALKQQQEEAAASLSAEIEALQAEAAELLAQEEAAAEAARQAAMAYASGPTGPVSDEQLARVFALGLRYPFYNYQPLSSPFGPRDFDGFHYGADFACSSGTPVLAVAPGTVVSAGVGGAMGVYVIIMHGNGIRSIYMHNSSLNVSTGQYVSAGEVIAYSGSTGNSTGPHLHLQIEVDLTPVNPMIFL